MSGKTQISSAGFWSIISNIFNFCYEKFLSIAKIGGAFLQLLKYSAIVIACKSMIQVCVFFGGLSKKVRSVLWSDKKTKLYYDFIFVAEILIGENGEKILLEKIEKQKVDFLHRRIDVKKQN
jgi:hypothetical protein